jgi:hypothetical protein
VLGAMVLMGSVTAAVVALLTTGRRGDQEMLRRFAYRTMLYVGLPAWIVMFASGTWLYYEEFDAKDDPTWVHIGVITAEGGLVLFLVALGLARSAARRAKPRRAAAAGILGAIVLAGWVVAVWAMGAKPG